MVMMISPKMTTWHLLLWNIKSCPILSYTDRVIFATEFHTTIRTIQYWVIQLPPCLIIFLSWKKWTPGVLHFIYVGGNHIVFIRTIKIAKKKNLQNCKERQVQIFKWFKTMKQLPLSILNLILQMGQDTRNSSSQKLTISKDSNLVLNPLKNWYSSNVTF